MDGFLLLDKPAGLTSFDCIKKIKKLINVPAKIGHAGTLDMFATGLLIVAIGRTATKHIKAIMTLDKVYCATARYGQRTDTLDCTGTIVEQNDSFFDETLLLRSIEQLGQQYWQVPPIFSALKYQGRRLSDLARKTTNALFVEKLAINKKNLIDIYSIDILNFSKDFFTIRAHVSHGTYIRSLVNDLAQCAGNCATTIKLRREKIGPFSVEDALSLDDLENGIIRQNIISISDILRAFETYKKNQIEAHQKRKLSLYKTKLSSCC